MIEQTDDHRSFTAGRQNARDSMHAMRACSKWSLIMCTASAVGCVEPDHGVVPAVRVMVRDSSGVMLVENLTDTADLPIWRLADQPTIRLGVVEGDTAQQFGDVAAATLLSDGTIVVADDQAKEVRFFSNAGQHIRTVGGPGRGPGEFQNINSLQKFRGDSVLVWDALQQRATIFAPEGAVASVVQFSRVRTEQADGSPGPTYGLRPVVRGSGDTWISVGRPSAVKPQGLKLPGLHAYPVQATPGLANGLADWR